MFIKQLNLEKNMLFRFLDGENTEYHNNNVEKTIRSNIIIRKIMCGNCSKRVYVHRMLMIYVSHE